MPIQTDTNIASKKDGEDCTTVSAQNRVLLHCPDITLKGKNQDDFQNALQRDIKRRLKHASYNWTISASRGRMLINVPEGSDSDLKQVLYLMRQVPGVSTLASARWVCITDFISTDRSVNWQLLEEEIVALSAKHFVDDACFAIRVNRTDKKLPVTSQQIGARLGEIIRQRTQWDRVKLKSPDQIFYIDIYPDGLYLYADKLTGVGGLPVGTGGNVLALLSGGIDSPVAAFLLAKRGCSVDLFHVTASHMQEPELKKSVIGKLASQLSQYTQQSRLYVVPNTYFDLALSRRSSGFDVVLFRRFMMRFAEQLAAKIHAQVLINGDSLGQVASQTLENIVSSSKVVSIPILRPLIGSNKQEIISIARSIGTYDISIKPYKDCCALIARNPRTKSRHEQLTQLENKQLPDYDKIISNTFKDMLCLEYKNGDFVRSVEV